MDADSRGRLADLIEQYRYDLHTQIDQQAYGAEANDHRDDPEWGAVRQASIEDGIDMAIGWLRCASLRQADAFFIQLLDSSLRHHLSVNEVHQNIDLVLALSVELARRYFTDEQLTAESSASLHQGVRMGHLIVDNEMLRLRLLGKTAVEQNVVRGASSGRDC